MPKDVGRRYTTFLVAVTAEPADGAAVYAVKARCPDEALGIVRAGAEAGPDVAIVGSLSSRMAKAIRLVVGEMRPV